MSARKGALHRDLARVDAHRITGERPAEIAELSDGFVDSPDKHTLGVPLKRGRGRPIGAKKAQLNLRIDKDVIDAFKRQGDGWQTRMNDALREWAQAHGMLT